MPTTYRIIVPTKDLPPRLPWSFKNLSSTVRTWFLERDYDFIAIDLAIENVSGADITLTVNRGDLTLVIPTGEIRSFEDIHCEEVEVSGTATTIRIWANILTIQDLMRRKQCERCG